MGKLRNASTEVGQFVQWLGRKCRNHNPLEELALEGSRRRQAKDRYKARAKADVFVLPGSEERELVYLAGDRAFKITVEEVEPETVPHQHLIPVGH